MGERFIPMSNGTLINLSLVEEMSWDEEGHLYVMYSSGKVSTFPYKENPIPHFEEWLYSSSSNDKYGRVYGT